MRAWPLVAAAGLAASSQAPPPRQAETSAPAEVVRITLSLVQVDAVVTDKDGRYVTDLEARDFEILEDGRPQEIAHCVYVSTAGSLLPVASPAAAPSQAPAPPPTQLRPEQVRRALALVVDDLGLSFQGTVNVRDALKKFVDEQMQPGDLVAILRTSAGMGALQQFTTDKRLLHAAIDRVRFSALSRFGVEAFAPVGQFKSLLEAAGRQPRGSRGPAGEGLDRFREGVLAGATLESVKFVIRGLRDLPGRKAVVLFSDGLRLGEARTDGRRSLEPDPRTRGALGTIIDLANRASVVVYAIDTTGLPTLAFTAADDVNTLSATADVPIANFNRNRDLRGLQNRENQEGLRFLADETGGFLLRNQNDVSRSVDRVLEDQRGYYLIGYAPDPSTFKTERDQPSFHKIKVKVKRPGLRVRSRAGFYGLTDDDPRVVPATNAGHLLGALTSPFTSGDVHLQLRSLFFHDLQRGSFLRSFLHVDPRDLSLEEEADGSRKARVDILAVTFGDNGKVVDQIGRGQEIRVAPQHYEKVLQKGIVYTIDVPVKKPGAYQLRVAIRDAASGRVGSANQLVEVPDLGRKRLALSGLLMGVEGADPTSATAESAEAVRRFRPGKPLSYGFMVYNARLDPAKGRPKLAAQVRLFRDGQPVMVGAVRPVDLGEQKDMRAVTAGGTLLIGPEMPPGEYILQVAVTDALAPSKNRTATGTVDFEVAQ